jgi:NAD+ synthase (glutamine-hydrolysing)
MRKFRLAMAQINPTVGDMEGNTAKIIQYLDQARALGADLVAFPELAIPGYPPEDLVFKPQFVRDNRRCMEKVVAASEGIAVVVGFVDANDGIYNAAAVAYNGDLVGIYHKIYLPNYSVFDEGRYFEPGSECPVYVVNGVGIGVNVCEDIWYELGPTNIQRRAGAEVIVNINGSPFYAGKSGFRRQMLAKRALDNGVVVSYTNMVGGQDELVFDGGSAVFDRTGQLVTCGGQFQEELVVADLEVDGVFNGQPSSPERTEEDTEALRRIGHPVMIQVADYQDREPRDHVPRDRPCGLDPEAEVYAALVMGTRDYIRKNGFTKVLIGLSGGIDSTLTAVIAAEALGKENVVAVTMPSRYSSEGSITDSKAVAETLGIELLTIPIEIAFTAYLDTLEAEFRGTKPGIAEENLQARVRGNLLMALSNKFGWMVLTTGNKSELATGYSTLYGDMAGGFAVIKDVPKTLVYHLAAYVNRRDGRKVVPQSVIDKPPSAELRPAQKDEDSLPPYDVLDPILKAYVEDDLNYSEILGMGYDEEMVQRVIQLVDSSEYKRRQAPPGIKITPRNFGRDRRMPIVNRYRQF